MSGPSTDPASGARLNSIGNSGDVVTVPITYGDYYKVRYRLTYGALEDTKSGKKMLEKVDPAVARLVHNLAIADAGKLKSNELVAA